MKLEKDGGKTGTTTDNADIGYMGYSPYYVGGIWIGNDDSQMKVNTGSGSTSRLWENIMEKVHVGLEPAAFDEPQGVVKVNVCRQSGLLPTDLCSKDPRGSQVTSEYFLNGTVPTEFCDVHVTATVDSLSNMLMGPYCPPDLAEERVFIKRVENLYSGQILTEDSQYQVPTKICTWHIKFHYDKWLEENSTSSGIQDGTTVSGIQDGTTDSGIQDGTTDSGIQDGT